MGMSVEVEPTEPDVRVPPPRPRHIGTAMPDDRFLNREISWLDFNTRVLAHAGVEVQPGDLAVEEAVVRHRRTDVSRAGRGDADIWLGRFDFDAHAHDSRLPPVLMLSGSRESPG